MGTELALREVGLAPVARGSYVRGVDIDEALQRIVGAQPDAVVLVGTYEPCAEFIKKADALGLDAAFLICLLLVRKSLPDVYRTT